MSVKAEKTTFKVNLFEIKERNNALIVVTKISREIMKVIPPELMG